MSTRVNELIECDLSDVRLIATAPFLIEKAEECIPSCYRSRAYLGRELTKYVIIVMSALLLFGATALAQEEAASEAEPASAAEPAPEPQQEEKKRSPYYRKARGWLWIEAFAGPSTYDPDKFGSLSISGIQNAPRLSGPEYGFAFGTPFGGAFFLGFFYRQANYGQYKLLKTGLDMQGSIMIPYVHIILRGSIGFAKTFQGNPYDLANVDNGGVSFTGGLGLRIPIIRWISCAATLDRRSG